MAEPLQSGPMVHQGSAAEQMVPTDGAVRGGGDTAEPSIPPTIPAAPSVAVRESYPPLRDVKGKRAAGVSALAWGQQDGHLLKGS